MLVALIAILLGVPRPVRRQAHQPRQHGHAGRAGERRGHHGHRHGAHHRVPQHRPVGRLAGRRHRHGLRPAHDRLPAGRPGHPRGQPVHVDRGPGAWGSGWAPSSVPSRASSSPTSACPPSSSPSAGCSPCGGSSGCSRAARRSPASTTPSGRSVAEHSGRSAARRRGLLGIIGCLAIVGFLAYNRRQRRRFGFPLRPLWAEILHRGRRLRRRPRPGRLRQPELHAQGSRRPVGRRARHRGAAGRAADPDGHLVAHHHRRRCRAS